MLVAELAGDRGQRGGVDLRVRADMDAVGVGQDDVAVGLELAEDARHFRAGHAVQGDRLAIGLDEGHLVARADAEALPVDGAALLAGRGGDGHVRAAGADCAALGVADVRQVGCVDELTQAENAGKGHGNAQGQALQPGAGRVRQTERVIAAIFLHVNLLKRK
ncbi:hypothetical protein D3C81_1598010 [compost metagenome]